MQSFFILFYRCYKYTLAVRTPCRSAGGTLLPYFMVHQFPVRRLIITLMTDKCPSEIKRSFVLRIRVSLPYSPCRGASHHRQDFGLTVDEVLVPMKRYDYLSFIKTSTMMLIVAFHCSLFYSDNTFWVIKAERASSHTKKPD